MSALLSDPRVTVHIGDGFAYLRDTAASALFDVIITDTGVPDADRAALEALDVEVVVA